LAQANRVDGFSHAAHPMRRRVVLWGPPILYMMLIYYLSSEADPLPMVTGHAWDKLLHMAEYAGLAMLLGRALTGEGLTCARACLHAVLLTTAYGAIDEFHQGFVPMRASDFGDWIADAGGAAMGGLAFAFTRRALVFCGAWRGGSQPD
jgi:hypothetical protein